MPRVAFAVLAVVSAMTVLGNRDAAAQNFGRNKVEYVDFDFKVLETEHFSVYYYPAEEVGARIAAVFAERWYARLSNVLGHHLETRQPLILYGSQPEFAQTNVVGGLLGEGIGGVTESAKRRIVMPFAPTLAETERILGHEITHAFQYDMAKKYRGGMMWPLWAVEGLAQYLSLGASDPETAMWLRDAVISDLLPTRINHAAQKFSPYRFGHAFWAYLAGRFGDRVAEDVLKARPSSSLKYRIKHVTGVELDQLFTDWRAAAYERYAAVAQPPHGDEISPMLREKSGRLYLAPSLSPSGREAVFFSERDRLSVDLFLADTKSGTIRRKLVTTAGTARFESLQALRSAGSWSPGGDKFVFAAIEHGQPSLIILDIPGGQQERQITLQQFGQVLSPSWSPDGRTIAFAALEGGVTDLYLYDLDGGGLRRLTNDAFADLQPEWSPDGLSLAFVTDRFSSDLSTLSFGATEPALVDVASGSISALPKLVRAKHLNPQWSADGTSLFFLADPDGISNVYRFDVISGTLAQISDVPGAVAGLAPTSPALSVARGAAVMAFSVYRNGTYEIEIRRGQPALAGITPGDVPISDTNALPPTERAADIVEQALNDQRTGLISTAIVQPRAYTPRMFLEALGTPYLSTGGGPLGNFVRGGGSMLFSDLLGERKLALFAQAGNRLRDLALGVQYLNRERRWNWGGVAEIEPSIRRLPRTRFTNQESGPAVARETQYFERTQVKLAGQAAYPLNHTQRLEFESGIRHVDYRLTVSSLVRSLTNGRVLSRGTEEGTGGEPATMGETSAAFVRDTAVFGPTSPLLGERSRFEVSSTYGELSVTRLLLEHRRYFMPVRPYTIAARLVHLGQYGRDAEDPRVLPSFLGSRQFLRGYGWGSLRCQVDDQGECSAFEELLGSRLMVGNIEVRAPLLGIRHRELRYGPLPVEAFLFADSGLVWARSAAFTAAGRERRLVGSFGLGARINAFGMPMEFAAVRAMSAPARGWSFDVSFHPGF
jgi:hypothetical protein